MNQTKKKSILNSLTSLTSFFSTKKGTITNNNRLNSIQNRQNTLNNKTKNPEIPEIPEKLLKFDYAIKLLNESSTIDKPNFLTYSHNIPDIEFLDNNNNNPNASVYKPLEWYNKINPKFENLNYVNPNLPEFKPLIQQFIKDLIVLFTTEEFPKIKKADMKIITNRNIEKINFYKTNSGKIMHKILGEPDLNYEHANYKLPIADYFFVPREYGGKHSKYKTIDLKFTYKTSKSIMFILDLINKTIQKNYEYVDIMQCFKSFIVLFSFNINLDKLDEIMCLDQIKLIDDLMNTPFLIYPSFIVPNHYKTLLLLGAPIINVWCMNRIGVIHNMLFKPCLQIFHDLNVHGRLTHQYNKNTDAQKLNKIFFSNNKFLQELLTKYKYDNKTFKNVGEKGITLNNIEKNDTLWEYFNFIIIIFLFTVLHEETLNFFLSDEKHYTSEEILLKAKEIINDNKFNDKEKIYMNFYKELDNMNLYKKLNPEDQIYYNTNKNPDFIKKIINEYILPEKHLTNFNSLTSSSRA